MFGYVSAYTVESRNVLHGNTRKSTVSRAMHGVKMPSEGRGRPFKSGWVLPFQPFSTCNVCGNVYGYHTKRAGKSAPTDSSPVQKTCVGGFMADSFPKRILPFLEGKIGELRKMRFWSKVDMRGPDECWDWQAGLTSTGYGRFKIASYTTVIASRFALISHTGKEPTGMLVLHNCDRPVCCNPHHLRFGTAAENTKDMVTRGRTHNGSQSGLNNGNAKLNEEQLQQIIEGFRARKSNCEIAKEIGVVSHSMISRIRVGRSWQTEAAKLGWLQ